MIPFERRKEESFRTGIPYKHRGQRLKALLFFLRKSKHLKEIQTNESRRTCVQNLSLHLLNDVAFFSGLNNAAVASKARKKGAV